MLATQHNYFLLRRVNKSSVRGEGPYTNFLHSCRGRETGSRSSNQSNTSFLSIAFVPYTSIRATGELAREIPYTSFLSLPKGIAIRGLFPSSTLHIFLPFRSAHPTQAFCVPGKAPYTSFSAYPTQIFCTDIESQQQISFCYFMGLRQIVWDSLAPSMDRAYAPRQGCPRLLCLP